MSDLQKKFERATEDVQKLTKRPDNDTLLKLYAYYKQATVGDASGKRPGFTDIAGRAKFDAWKKQKGMSAEDAKHAYIDLVNGLIEG